MASEENEDRISKLPDDLLVRIISLLPTTEDAYKTCILSKRWRCLWTLLPTFILSHCYYRERQIDKFVSFVDYVLGHSLSSTIEKFELYCSDLFHYGTKISQWLTFVSQKQVKYVMLSTVPEYVWTLFESFCTCSSLITLHLVYCVVDDDVPISWKSLESLKFEEMHLSDSLIMKLVSGCPALETLELNLFEGVSRLDFRSSKLKRLILTDFNYDGGDNILEIIAPYLQHLEITRSDYDDMHMNWKSLKSLKLEKLMLSNGHIMKLLSNCPALETLELILFEGVSRIDLRSSELKGLILKCYNSLDTVGTLEIDAPCLQHLEVSGDLHDIKCKLVNVSSVVNAKLTFEIRCIKDILAKLDQEFDNAEGSCGEYHQGFQTLVLDYLQKLRCATEITIGTWFTQVLCMLQFKGVPIPDLKCKYLTLELHIQKFNLYGAAGLLRASPHVETLNIDMSTTAFEDSRCRFELRDLAIGDNIDLQNCVSSFVFPNLKNVKIAIFPGRCLKNYVELDYVKKLFKLSEFLLKDASVLEKFVIISRRRRCETCSVNCVNQYFFPLVEKLSVCPRSSTNCAIIFQE